MTLVAGLASLDHPHARTDPTVAVLATVIAVPQTPGHDSRQDRYRLAAHWCAAGPFLPLSWTHDLTMEDVRGGVIGAADGLRVAVALAADRIEYAVRIFRELPDAGPTKGTGRAYLRGLKSGRDSFRTVVDDLLASASEAAFTVSRVTRRQDEASCLIGCARSHADRVERAVRGLCDRGTGSRMAFAGPLPPFGAGFDAIALMGLGRKEQPA